MKKSSIYLLALLAVMMFTSCGNDDDPVNKQTLGLTFNARVIDDSNENNIIFSQSNGQVELNYTDMTAKMTCSYKDLDGKTMTFNSPIMDMKPYSSTIYELRINGSDSSTASRMGYIDLSTGMVWYKDKNQDGSATLIITSQLVYPYLSTTVTDKDGHQYIHEQSGYIFAIDSKGETAIMAVFNFVPETGGAIQAAELDYDGLKVTHTATGYRITADECTCKQADYYNLHDLEVNITDQGMVINGSYKVKDNTYTMSGSLIASRN